ncbi:MAG TPA: DNA polymerase III subunit delta' [Methylovirgula sp.]|nr:DNA polymerase III subunit delta' [Methylovirgula sp.]
MAPRPIEAPPEADRFEDAPHPREIYAFFGHAEAERALLEACKADRLPQAFIIGGEPGVGKATLAWRLARFLLANPDPALAQGRDLSVAPTHPVARKIAALSHGNLVLLRREWNEKTRRHFSEIRVDDVRQASRMFQQAAEGYRIAIVDSADELNRSAANALLKLIEEPPPRSLFLIVAHRPALILPTLRSRCRMLHLRPLGADEVLAAIEALGEPWTEIDPQARRIAAERARGSVSAALRLLSEDALEKDKLLRRLLDNLPGLDWRAVHTLAENIGRDEAEFERLMAAILDWIDTKLQSEAGQGAARLAPLAEVWEKAAEAAREAEAMNLDKRPLILSIFADLAAARAIAA